MSDKPIPHHLITDPEAALAEAMEQAPCFTATTANIVVTVRSFWLEDQSHPEDHHFAWAYHIRIENRSDETVQLLSRAWEIVDGRGQVEHVRGEGVVGEQPVIAAGGEFEYTSGAALETPGGFMRGQYHMVRPADRQQFDIAIPPFSLDCPHQSGIMH
ncbi:Co2+/Mg2+ efflux protein ApaG [Tanticharoenia sakaeratensis]|jgi:ApaG protein|uniref:Protein ApaG n=1 Tax=Tanticharoenia sakaeratensis NBRC 103193 TaxID=1231623 RepID=A0A0D6MIF9_9PROT|nr:Co2+/Mg2+ efflux protein ApaG [Tanticharoenia sakaeratensis]GAN53068.1 ApaG protein [Tanticharoenia sakaeratensis NBRC 103193]GBQ19612.1 ApaG protein [Tanticharoenia sakaeratensis NBRC 103193]